MKLAAPRTEEFWSAFAFEANAVTSSEVAQEATEQPGTIPRSGFVLPIEHESRIFVAPTL